MSCFLPSSVILKSAGLRPLMGFPLLSFTVTSTTTNWVVAPNLTTPLGAGRAVPRPALKPESQRGRQAAHVARTGKQPQVVAPDGGVEAAECHVVQRVG